MPDLQVAFAGFRRQPGGNFAFTMVPNQFLDEIVPFEKPCVVKVVCLILRRTLGWTDEHGQRRQQDQVAYSEFAREMNMSTQAIADGVRTALEKGYIVRTKPGGMQPGSEGAWYGLKWEQEAEARDQRPETKGQRPEARNQRPEVRKPNLQSAICNLQSPLESEKQSEEASLNFRDMRNKGESKIKPEVEIKPSSTPERDGKFSAYIGNVITDLSRQFGDEAHRLPNIKQALNLWNKQVVPEADFVQLLYTARDRTRLSTSAAGAPGQVAAMSVTDGPRNRMPYFFRVLRDLIKLSQLDINQNVSNDTLLERRAVLGPKKSAPYRPLPVKTADLPEPPPPCEMQSSQVDLAIAPGRTLLQVQEVIGPRAAHLPGLEVSEVNRAWAERYTTDPAQVLERWQRLASYLELPALAGRVLAVEIGLAQSALRSALGLASAEKKLDVVVLCKAFEGSYLQNHLEKLQAGAAIIWKQAATFHFVYI